MGGASCVSEGGKEGRGNFKSFARFDPDDVDDVRVVAHGHVQKVLTPGRALVIRARPPGHTQHYSSSTLPDEGARDPMSTTTGD